MTLEVFLALLGFSLVASATPGPNTLMLLASGVNFGLGRTVPHMIGIGIGFVLLLLGLGFGMGQLLKVAPGLYTALKIAGALYLLYLAWRIANSGSLQARQMRGRPFTVLEAAAFQWVNPKAWVMGVSAMTIYTDPQNHTATALLVVAAFALVLVPSVVLWAGMGSVLRQFLADPKRLRVFNITMALLLVASLWPMLR